MEIQCPMVRVSHTVSGPLEFILLYAPTFGCSVALWS